MTGQAGIARAMLLLVFAGYGLLVIGGYRALTGRQPAREGGDALSSLRRIGTGIGTGVGVVALAFGLLFVLLLGVGAVMGWK